MPPSTLDADAHSPAIAPVALVTGSGAPRVGRVVAKALGERGYRVVLHANTSLAQAQAAEAEFIAAGIETFAVQANLADEAEVARMFELVDARFGRIDVLVNAAAIWIPRSLEETNAALVRQHFEVNTLGTFLCAKAAGLRMVAQDAGGVIINFGDWACVRPYPNYAGYFPSKGSIPTLTRDFAIELAARNPRVRVNAILPGPVMLPPDLSPEERAGAIAGTLVKREGTPLHVAHAVLFLVKNDFVTGVCLPVDGGRTICSD